MMTAFTASRLASASASASSRRPLASTSRLFSSPPPSGATPPRYFSSWRPRRPNLVSHHLVHEPCIKRGPASSSSFSVPSTLLPHGEARLFSSSASTALLRSALSPTLPRLQPRWINGRGGGWRGQEGNDGEDGKRGGDKDSEGRSRKHGDEGEEGKTVRGAGEGGGVAGSSGGAGSGSSGSGSGGGGQTSLQRNIVPPVYPQVLALPITRRPLFPGFYKAVVINDPAVCAAITEMMKRGQPYLGAFLLKDAEGDADVITSLDEIHRVGVFAQITSVFPVQARQGEQSTGDKKSEEGKPSGGLTAVLYPHRRIRIDDLLPPVDASGKRPSALRVHEITQAARDEGVIGPSPGELDVPDAEKGYKTEQEAIEAVQRGEAEELGEVATCVMQQEGEQLSENEGADARELEESQVQRREPPGHPAPYHTSFLEDYRVSLANVTNLQTAPYDKTNQIVRAVMAEIISVFKDIAQLNPLFRDQIANFSISQGAGNVFEEPDKLADFAAAVSAGEVGELQAVLESLVIEDRLQKALLVLKKELMNAQLQSKISRDVESKIQKRQREYYLMEQLKGIKKELGIESDGKDKLVEKFKEKAAKLAMPEGVRKVFEEEISKLQHLEPAASEFNVTRNYLDWLTQIPWGQHTPENFDIKHAVKVLDEDHYGLKDVKDRILEFLGVSKLRGSVEGKIICLHGPPGVGKTSIGKSIARALNREFYRFSVGGLSDVAELKGHRRTYVGAMPGKVIQALKKVQSENPLVLIDEVDKIGRGHNGDPSSALLEVLDPEQNTSFLDHYMDVPVDLSKVLFVCTANLLDTIPGPLLDRMELIEVSSYTADEKVNIARGYLAPQAKEASGLKDANVVLSDATIEFLIKHHCRESGVRGLRKILEKIYRKVAFNIVTEHADALVPMPRPDENATRQATPVPISTITDSASIPTTETPPSSPASDSSASPSSGIDSASDSASVKSGSTDATSAGESNPQPDSSAHQPGNSSEDELAKTTQSPPPLRVPEHIRIEITPDNLKDYVGPPVYHKDRLFVKQAPAGISTGLGYLGNGSGSVMAVETTIMPGKGQLQLTGKLGDVIRESATIALSWMKSNAYALGISKTEGENLLENRDVHLHMPEGSVGKEGPSAGVAFVCSLTSLLTNRSLPTDLAMSGEISLRGIVMPVGGLKEKLLAAHRAGIKRVILPAQNRPDVETHVPKVVLEALEVNYVSHVWSALEIAFGKDGPWAEKAKAMRELEKEEAELTGDYGKGEDAPTQDEPVRVR